MKISIVGSGYVGLVTGACLAKLGNKVILIDLDEERVKLINNGVDPIREKGLSELLRSGNIEASSDYQKIADSEVIFLCVGTHSEKGYSVCLEYLTNAAEQVSQILKDKKAYYVVSVKSTVPPGTTEDLVIPILQRSGKKLGEDFGVCMLPEFLSEGNAVYDFMHPDRVVIGEYDTRAGDTCYSLFQGFDVPILRTDLRTAEMIKLASNAFLANKVSFINEIGNICKELGIDTHEVARGIGLDQRIGSKFLQAGIGFGGSCLPKDLNMLITKAREIGYEPKMLEATWDLNEMQALKPMELLKKYVSIKNATIGILGLAFKPGTDDVRGSRAIDIVETLLKEGAEVKAYDPMALENFKKLFPSVEYVSEEEVLNSDVTLIITEWEEFNSLDYKDKVIIDGRGISKAREARIYERVC
jgi:UDPglucose 6-dehydrogenase